MLRQEKFGWKPLLNFLLQRWRLEFYQLALPYSLPNLIFCLKFVTSRLELQEEECDSLEKVHDIQDLKEQMNSLDCLLRELQSRKEKIDVKDKKQVSHWHQIRTVLGIRWREVKTNNLVWTFKKKKLLKYIVNFLLCQHLIRGTWFCLISLKRLLTR